MNDEGAMPERLNAGPLRRAQLSQEGQDAAPSCLIGRMGRLLAERRDVDCLALAGAELDVLPPKRWSDEVGRDHTKSFHLVLA